MPRGIGAETLEKKIEKAKEKVCRTKASYEEAVDELKKLLDKQSALHSKELMKSIAKSDKTYDEIMKFIQINAKNTNGSFPKAGRSVLGV